MKELFLSKPYGFCFGVKKALDIVTKALAEYSGSSIYVFNEIVHNKTIVDELMAQGVHFTHDINQIPNGAVVIFSAHGVAPQVRKELAKRPVKILDATCPLVQKVHDEVNEYSAKGYHIIFIGDKKHDESIGIIAENHDNISVIETESDIPNIKKGFKNYIVLNQTTLNMFDVEKIFQKIKESIPGVTFPEQKDLCYTTTSRQQAVKENAKKCQLFLVVGSKNSSNSKKLRDIAAKEGCQAFLIDTYKDIKPEWLENKNKVFLTSGASAPDNLIQEVITFLTTEYTFTFIN
jgi:4-hydroxy-3-methylbut-2-enyl diphosphate reductase